MNPADSQTASRLDVPKHALQVSLAPDINDIFIPEEHQQEYKPSFVQRALSIPFAPQWAYGVDIMTKYKNLTTNKSNYKLFYVVSHVGILYTHATNNMQFLMGHRNLITSISADESGKWLVTADLGPDNSVIVWDSEDCFPVRTIFDPHPDVGVEQIEISHDAKFIVTVGAEEDPVIKFWLWTTGNDNADGTYTAKNSYGEVKYIAFNPNEGSHFAVTFSAALIFFTWDSKELTESVAQIPYTGAKNYGFYTETTYIPYSHECLTVTTNGWVIVWGLTFFTVPYESMPDNNNKLFIKAIRLQKDGISSIQYVDGVITTTDFRGNIRFYDEKLKILYFCHKFSLPPIIKTAFNLGKRKFIVQDPTVFSDKDLVIQEQVNETDEKEEIELQRGIEDEGKPITINPENEQIVKEETENLEDHNRESPENDIGKPEEQRWCYDDEENVSENVDPEQEIEIGDEKDSDEKAESNSYDDDRSDEYEKIYLNLLPSDFTLQRSPFLVRDYIILTTNGQFAYVDAVENKLDFFLSTNYSVVTSMDVHSEKQILILGYANGCIYTYNYLDCKLIVKRTIMNSKDEQNNEITCVRYSPQGLFLACGTSGGHLWLLDPITIMPIDKKPFLYEHTKILSVKFSWNNRYLAYFDATMAVCLLKRNDIENQNSEWVFHGRVIAHTKIITGMLFSGIHRLYTISKDRCLVEYDVKDSQPGKLDIISRTSIMQKGYPVTFTIYDMSDEETLYFLISTNEFKYLIINEANCTLERTVLAPFFGKPVSELRTIPNKDNKYMMFSTGKYLGIQMLPLSGNPYKQATLIAHSNGIKKFRISSCGKYAFTFGINDNVCIMWAIRSESVEYMLEQGGNLLNPYYALIEGGADGWLFQEMKDLFYYMQILHEGEHSPLPRQVSDKIPISEVPNLMRAVGYFPTEYELDNIIYEVKYYLETNLNEDEEEEINFLNFVKLYINHRPVSSFNKTEVKWAFEKLAVKGRLTRQQFIDILCEKGERFVNVSLQHCLSILSHNKSELLPPEVTYEYFMSEILGVENSDFL